MGMKAVFAVHPQACPGILERSQTINPFPSSTPKVGKMRWRGPHIVWHMEAYLLFTVQYCAQGPGPSSKLGYRKLIVNPFLTHQLPWNPPRDDSSQLRHPPTPEGYLERNLSIAWGPPRKYLPPCWIDVLHPLWTALGSILNSKMGHRCTTWCSNVLIDFLDDVLLPLVDLSQSGNFSPNLSWRYLWLDPK